MTNTGTTAKALSRRCEIPDRLLRGMNEPDWSPTLKTLLRIEQAIGDDPAWPSHDVYSWHEAKDEVGFIFCRNRKVSERDANTFGPVLDVYAKDVSEEDRLSGLAALSNVTVIDVTAEMPTEFFISKHAQTACAALGADYTGKRLREIQGKSYRDVLMQDCLRAKYTGDSLFNDILWANYGTTQGSFFQRLMLPLEGYVISAVHHHFTKFDGNLGYSEITSYFDT
ncbi:MAG: hypothetical protein O3B74_00635 [Proteobacteria bacterium]|nr:hypothetical protein [Pseudomonadota bacterium]